MAAINLAPNPANFKLIYNNHTRMCGAPQMYKLSCAACGAFSMYYQKDGNGRLTSCYKDRIHFSTSSLDEENLRCSECTNTLGTTVIYDREQRPAFRLCNRSITMERI